MRVDRQERQHLGGFAARLREVVAVHGSASGLARLVARSEGAVRKWLRGESEPNVTDLRALCQHTRTSIEWLVTGQGRRDNLGDALQEIPPPAYGQPATRRLQYELLERIMAAVDGEIARRGLELPSAKRSTLVITLYDLCRDNGELDEEALVRLVALAN